ncbi:MAG: hypothetical protein HYZ75_04355 [Elusimicrobia bacterium]|nr:hypothetical protein [Elusimicrobiota bacterium]
MPRKSHARKPVKDATEDFVKQFAALGRSFGEVVDSVVSKPEFQRGLADLTDSLRKAAQTGKAAGAENAAAAAKKLAEGFKAMASELDGFADKQAKKKKQ